LSPATTPRPGGRHGGLPSAHGSGGSFVIGYEKAFSEQLFGGVTLGYGNAPFDLGNDQGTVKYDEWALSAFAAHKFGAFYASALATYSWLDYREQAQRPSRSVQQLANAVTPAAASSAPRGRSATTSSVGNLAARPPRRARLGTASRSTASANSPNSATAMSFGEQTRESLRSRLGWQVAAETVLVRHAACDPTPNSPTTTNTGRTSGTATAPVSSAVNNAHADCRSANQTGGYGTLLAGVNAKLSSNTAPWRRRLDHDRPARSSAIRRSTSPSSAPF
jgi:hypothetical protein